MSYVNVLSRIRQTQIPVTRSILSIVWHLRSGKVESGCSTTLQSLQTLARLDVPDLDGGVRVAWDQDVVFQLHAAGEGLVAR